MKPTLRDASKKEFTIVGERGTHEEINTGSLQRIADSCERMGRNYIALETDLNWYKEAYERERNEKRRAWRRNSALRGVITKMKKKR